MWRSTGFQSLSFHDVAQCCDNGSVSFIHDERERTVSPCLEEADKVLEQAEQRVKQKIKQSRYALLKFTIQNQKASEDRHTEKRKRIAQVHSGEGGKENFPLCSQVASAASGASKRARSMAALAGEEHAPVTLPLKRYHNTTHDATIAPASSRSKRSAAEKEQQPVLAEEERARKQSSDQQQPAGPAAATRTSRCGAGTESGKNGEQEGGGEGLRGWGEGKRVGEERVRRTCTIKLDPGSYRLQPRLHRAKMRILPLTTNDP